MQSSPYMAIVLVCTWALGRPNISTHLHVFTHLLSFESEKKGHFSIVMRKNRIWRAYFPSWFAPSALLCTPLNIDISDITASVTNDVL